MKRKIIQQGPSTLVVSLPIKWVQRMGIKKGDEVEVSENGNEMIIKSSITPEIKEGSLDIRNLKPLTRRSIAAMYKAGYDKVTLAYENPSELEDVGKAIELEAMSFEIVEQTKNQCILRSISEPEEKEFDAILRRTLLLLKHMGEEVYKALKEGDIGTIATIKNLEKTNNKLTHYLRRCLNKSGYHENKKTNLLYAIVEVIEKTADEFKFLCDFLTNNKNIKISKDVFLIFENVNKSIAIFNSMFYNYNIKEAKLFANLRKEVVEDAQSIFNNRPSKDIVIAHYLLNIEQLIFDALGPYLTMTL